MHAYADPTRRIVGLLQFGGLLCLRKESMQEGIFIQLRPQRLLQATWAVKLGIGRKGLNQKENLSTADPEFGMF